MCWYYSEGEKTGHLLKVSKWSSVSGLSTGIGGLCVYCMNDINTNTIAAMLGFAAGVMITLSLLDMLLPVVAEFGTLAGLLGFGFGLLCTYLLCKIMADHEVSWDWLIESSSSSSPILSDEHTLPLIQRRDKKKETRKVRKLLKSAVMTTLALALHNAPEGVAVGLTVLSSETHSLESNDEERAEFHRIVLIVLAIALHNIPEGIAVATALYQATRRKHFSFILATMTGMVEPLSAIIAVLALDAGSGGSRSDDDVGGASGNLERVRYVSQMSLAVVAGVMVQVSLSELIPEARNASSDIATKGIITGAAIVTFGLYLLGDLG
eukprot:g533.t1